MRTSTLMPLLFPGLGFLLLAAGCSGKGGAADAGLDAGIECVLDADCALDDGDPCTVTVCRESACVIERRPAAIERIGAIVPPTPALALEYSSGRLIVAEGSAGVGEYRVRISDGTATITEQLRYPTTGPVVRARALNGHILAAEGVTGLEVFPDGVTTAQSLFKGPDEIVGLAMVDTTVIAFAWSKGLDFIDYSSWTAPGPGATTNTRGRATDAIAWNDKILVADGLAGIASIDFTTPPDFAAMPPTAPAMDPTVFLATEGRAVALRRRGDLLAVAESGAGAGLFDLGAPDGPDGPTRIAGLDLGGPVLDTDILSPHTVLFAASDGGLAIIDLLDPQTPVVWIREVLEAPVLDLDRSGEIVAVAMGSAGVAIYDLKCTPPPTDGGP